MKKYDAVIIGFGKGGKTLAAELAGHDRSVAMIERSDKMYGGTPGSTSTRAKGGSSRRRPWR